MDAQQEQQFFTLMAQQGAGHTPGYSQLEAARMGIPSLGGANMVFQPFMMTLASQYGLFPGQFHPEVNVADMMQAQSSYRQMSEEMSKATENVDVKNWLQITEGATRAMGGSYGLDQEAGFRNAYRQAAPIMSILAQVAPELVDQLHGVQGSAAVMTQGLFRGGQYRANMLSGIPGLRGDDFSTLSNTIQEELYSSPERIAAMQGVGMGQLGHIFDEAQRRGYMPGSLSTKSKPQQMQELSEATGKTADELEQLDKDDFGRTMRQFDSKRISSRLKELAGSITAMRDLFGSMGQANAPVSQLVNALEALTQNKLASMPASQVEQIVRQTKALMETTGVSLDGLMGLTSVAANYGDQLGLDRSLAIQAGQHAVSFESAYKQSFGSDYKNFGALSADQLAQQEAIRMQRASGSQQAQFAGAVVRTAEAFKVDAQSGMGRLAEAIKRGDTSFEGESMYDILRIGRLQELATRELGSDGAQAFTQASRDTFGNQEYIQKYDIGSTIRRLQPQEITQMSLGVGQNALMGSLIGQGMSQDEARAKAKESAPLIMRSLLESEDPAKLSTQQGRQDIIRQALAKDFGEAKAAELAPSVTLAFESQMNTFARSRGLGDVGKILQSQNVSVLRQENQVQRMVAADVEIDKALSPLGRAGPIARVMDMIRNTKKDDGEIGALLGQALGGIEVSKIRGLIDDTEQIRQLGAKSGPLSDDDRAVLDLARERVRDTIKDVQDKAKDGKVDIGRVVDEDVIARMTGSADEVKTAKLEKDPKRRISRTSEAVRMELTRTNNFVQALYLDDASMRRLSTVQTADQQAASGRITENQKAQLEAVDNNPKLLAKALAGDASVPEAMRKEVQALQGKIDADTRKVGPTALDRVKSIESKYTQLLRLSGGDTDLLAKAVNNDASVPAELRKQIQSIHGKMETETAELGRDLRSQGPVISDEMFSGERKRIEAFRNKRTATDADQTKGMAEDLLRLGGITSKQVTDEDRERIKSSLGEFGTTKRKDVMLAIEARQRLAGYAADQGVTVETLRTRGAYADDFAQAGRLSEFGAKGQDNLSGLTEALKGFAPDEPATRAQNGEKGMRISGTLNLQTGAIAGMGYGEMGGNA